MIVVPGRLKSLLEVLLNLLNRQLSQLVDLLATIQTVMRMEPPATHKGDAV